MDGNGTIQRYNYAMLSHLSTYRHEIITLDIGVANANAMWEENLQLIRLYNSICAVETI